MAFKIYTKTGDKGETSLFGGARLSKDDIRIEAYGTVDELNAVIGMLIDSLPEKTTALPEVQKRLFTIGANLASDPSKEMLTPDLSEQDIQFLEENIDLMDEDLPALKHFVLPGGHPSVSIAHLARTVCRRAERRVITLHRSNPVDEIIIKYLNRLSDYLFVLSRHIGYDLKVSEVYWKPRS